MLCTTIGLEVVFEGMFKIVFKMQLCRWETRSSLCEQVGFLGQGEGTATVAGRLIVLYVQSRFSDGVRRISHMTLEQRLLVLSADHAAYWSTNEIAVKYGNTSIRSYKFLHAHPPRCFAFI